MKIKVILAVLMVSILCGCERGLGDYVYIDCIGCLHTDRKCIEKSLSGEIESGVAYKNIGVRYIPIDELTEERKELRGVCPSCVTDRQMDQLRKLYQEK